MEVDVGEVALDVVDIDDKVVELVVELVEELVEELVVELVEALITGPIVGFPGKLSLFSPVVQLQDGPLLQQYESRVASKHLLIPSPPAMQKRCVRLCFV